jgi:hypothetical protein
MGTGFFSRAKAPGASFWQFTSIYSAPWLSTSGASPLLLLYYFIGVERLKFIFIFSRGSEIYPGQVTVLGILGRPCRLFLPVPLSLFVCSILRLLSPRAPRAISSPCTIVFPFHEPSNSASVITRLWSRLKNHHSFPIWVRKFCN